MSSDTQGGIARQELSGPGTLSSSTLRYTGWAVFLSLFGLLLAWTFGILFLTQGGIFAPLSDISSLLYNLPLLIVAWVLYRVYRRNAPVISGVVFAVGVAGALLSVVAGAGLTITDLGVRTGAGGALLTGQRIGGFITGFWLLGVSSQEIRQGAFDRRVAIAGFVGGVGLILLDASLLIGGEGHPGFGLGSIVQLIGTALWSVWLGRRFLSGSVRSPSSEERESTATN